MLSTILALFVPSVHATWHFMNPAEAFNAGFSYGDYNSGACNGGNKNAAYMQAPYITKTSTSITARIPQSAQGSRACIYQHTQNSCQFFIGSNGLTQLEFDYEITGDRWSNWFSFWINSSRYGNWVKDCEIDSLENMYKSLAHNFAGEGHQVPFKSQDGFKGHVTTVMSDTGARITDCAYGSQTCQMTGDVAYHNWSSATANDIRNGQIKHHLDIDYWFAELPSSLTVSNIYMWGQGAFSSMCQGVSAVETEFYQLTAPTEEELRAAEAKRDALVSRITKYQSMQ